MSRRERQIMDILYRRGRATAAEVLEELPGNTHDSTVRTQLRVLEEKGHIRHEEEGLRYVYMPAVPRHAARKSVLTPCATGWWRIGTHFRGARPEPQEFCPLADGGLLAPGRYAGVPQHDQDAVSNVVPNHRHQVAW